MRRLLERFALSFALGLLAPFVFIIGAEPFAVGGRTSVGEVAAGCLAGTLYLAGCQFWVARKENRGLVANWPTVIGIGHPSARSFDPHATRRKTWHCDITGASDVNRRLRGDPSRDRIGRAAHKADQHPERRRVVMELGSWWSCSKQRCVVLRLVEQRLKPRVAGGSRFWHS